MISTRDRRDGRARAERSVAATTMKLDRVHHHVTKTGVSFFVFLLRQTKNVAQKHTNILAHKGRLKKEKRLEIVRRGQTVQECDS